MVYCKGDWAEFCERFGFPNHASALRPCFMCACPPGPGLYDPLGVSLLETPWRQNLDADFEGATRACELKVNVTAAHHSALKRLLRFDKRRQGSQGLALLSAFAPLGLEAGDRLEPSANLPDVGDFDSLAHFPVELIFWRVSRSSLVAYKCLLWAPALGLTPVNTIALDMLHTFYLGPLLSWCRDAIWCLLMSGKWGASEHTDFERHLVALSCVKHELFSFYKAYDAAHPSAKLSRVSSLTPKMLGIGGARRLKTKAAETWGIALFLVDFLPKHSDAVDPGMLHIGQLLVRFLLDMKSYGPRLSVSEQQSLLDTWKRFLSAANRFDLFTPKCHLMLHVVLRAGRLGNPTRYDTFLDESLNSTLKSVVRLCHQSNFERLGLLKLEEAIGRPAVRQRVR